MMPVDFVYHGKGEVPEGVISLICDSRSPSKFPRTLKILQIYDNNCTKNNLIIRIPNFPEGVLEIIMHCPCLKNLPPLPESLKTLDLTKCISLRGMLRLPRNVIKVCIFNTGISGFETPLPPGLQTINCEQSPFYCLPKIPAGFTSLTGLEKSLIPRLLPKVAIDALRNSKWDEYNDWLENQTPPPDYKESMRK